MSALNADRILSVMFVCSKMDALAALGHKSFSLPDILPNLCMDKQLAKRRFVPPVVRLSAGKDMRKAHKLYGPRTTKLAKRIGQDILSGWERRHVHAELEVGFAGQGSNSNDILIILVEEATPNRAWVLNIRSK